jgi:hypothetical protein
MKKSCETCEHWDDPTRWDDDRPGNIRKCTKAVQMFDAEDWGEIDGKVRRVLLPEYKDQMMFTQDGSSYHASLYTRNDFFCAHWDKK